MAHLSSLLASAACLMMVLFALVTPASAKLTQIATIPGPQSLENIAVRSNGQLLVTSTTSNSVYMISPNGTHDPVPVVTIDNGANATLGIAELTRDVFYVIAAKVNGLTMIPGSVSIWKADLNPLRLRGNAVAQPASVTLLTNVPSAKLYNGMCRLSKNDTRSLLIADSVAGTVTRLDVETRQTRVVIDDAAMRMTAPSPPLGVDGIRTAGNTLYFTNFQGFFASVPISPADGSAAGPVRLIANLTAGDDFTLTPDGKAAIVAQNGQMALARIDLGSGNMRVIANSTLLGAASSAAFGRGCADSRSVYVTGDGGKGMGSVVKVDL
ncbi:hypothetical protein GGR52DRAFT_593062 [Hypoxylon sp. FL1284]|nr:hypothetical protein GGR52DRAFT_593062 [Hypoxylon sp. FL1284]